MCALGPRRGFTHFAGRALQRGLPQKLYTTLEELVELLDRLPLGDESDTAGLRAAQERSPQERSAGALRLTAA